MKTRKPRVCCIYKITSPTNRIYIGQSSDMNTRLRKYKNPKHCKDQIRLYNSFEKYGTDSHKIEILEHCNPGSLNIRERFYQKLYNVLDDNKGLNCKLTNARSRRTIYSKETRLKMSKSHTGVPLSESHRLNLCRPVINIENGVFYDSVKDAATALSIRGAHLSRFLNGKRKNKTYLRYA